jgi:hypothetical protein
MTYRFPRHGDTDEMVPKSKPCPYHCDIHQLINTVETTRLSVLNDIVKVKQPAEPIRTGFLLTLHDHIDVLSMDRPGASSMRDESSKDRRKELTKDGNDTIYKILPPFTKSSLQRRGKNVQNLRQAAEDAPFSITGVLTKLDADFRHKICQYFVIDDTKLVLMNQHLNDLLLATFDMSAIRMKHHPLHAVIAFQTITIAMLNRILTEKNLFSGAFTALSSERPSTLDKVLNVTQCINTYSVGFNVIGSRIAFDDELDPQVLSFILDSIQSGITSLPFAAQAEANQALSVVQSLISERHPVDSNTINNLLLPIYAKVSKAASPSDESAFAAMTVAPGPRSDSRTPPADIARETAFYSRTDQRSRPQYDNSSRQPQDSRQRLTVQLPVREVRRVPTVQEPPRHTPRPDRADSPVPTDAEIDDLHKSIKAQQKQLTAMKKTQKAFLAQHTITQPFPLAQPFPEQYEDEVSDTPEYSYHAAVQPTVTLSSQSARSSRRSSSRSDY